MMDDRVSDDYQRDDTEMVPEETPPSDSQAHTDDVGDVTSEMAPPDEYTASAEPIESAGAQSTESAESATSEIAEEVWDEPRVAEAASSRSGRGVGLPVVLVIVALGLLAAVAGAVKLHYDRQQVAGAMSESLALLELAGGDDVVREQLEAARAALEARNYSAARQAMASARALIAEQISDARSGGGGRGSRSGPPAEPLPPEAYAELPEEAAEYFRQREPLFRAFLAECDYSRRLRDAGVDVDDLRQLRDALIEAARLGQDDRVKSLMEQMIKLNREKDTVGVGEVAQVPEQLRERFERFRAAAMQAESEGRDLGPAAELVQRSQQLAQEGQYDQAGELLDQATRALGAGGSEGGRRAQAGARESRSGLPAGAGGQRGSGAPTGSRAGSRQTSGGSGGQAASGRGGSGSRGSSGGPGASGSRGGSSRGSGAPSGGAMRGQRGSGAGPGGSGPTQAGPGAGGQRPSSASGMSRGQRSGTGAGRPSGAGAGAGRPTGVGQSPVPAGGEAWAQRGPDSYGGVPYGPGAAAPAAAADRPDMPMQGRRTQYREPTEAPEDLLSSFLLQGLLGMVSAEDAALQAAYDWIDNARVAIREKNADQIREILDRALQQLRAVGERRLQFSAAMNDVVARTAEGQLPEISQDEEAGGAGEAGSGRYGMRGDESGSPRSGRGPRRPGRGSQTGDDHSADLETLLTRIRSMNDEQFEREKASLVAELQMLTVRAAQSTASTRPRRPASPTIDAATPVIGYETDLEKAQAEFRIRDKMHQAHEPYLTLRQADPKAPEVAELDRLFTSARRALYARNYLEAEELVNEGLRKLGMEPRSVLDGAPGIALPPLPVI